MSEQGGEPLALGEDHRRGIATTLTLLDELLCRVEEWAAGRAHRGALYEERNDLVRSQRRLPRQEVARLRRRLETIRQDLGLQGTTELASSDIWARCTSFADTLMELDAHHLRRYGEVRPNLAGYMDALSRDLLAGLDSLLEVVRPGQAGERASAAAGDRSTG